MSSRNGPRLHLRIYIPSSSVLYPLLAPLDLEKQREALLGLATAQVVTKGLPAETAPALAALLSALSVPLSAAGPAGATGARAQSQGRQAPADTVASHLDLTDSMEFGV